MSDFKELLDRVKAASVPDDELDEAICVAVGCKLHEYWWPVPGENGASYAIPPVTASIDAALAIVDRVLPDANCVGFDKNPLDTSGYVSHNYVDFRAKAWLYEEQGATPALAILAAFLTALIAQKAAG